MEDTICGVSKIIFMKLWGSSLSSFVLTIFLNSLKDLHYQFNLMVQIGSPERNWEPTVRSFQLTSKMFVD